MPMTRSRAIPSFLNAVCAMASSGLETMMKIALGEAARAFSATSLMILKLVFRRSSRLMPGLRAMPAVMTTMSELAVSA
jgi:hypothetical protein